MIHPGRYKNIVIRDASNVETTPSFLSSSWLFSLVCPKKTLLIAAGWSCPCSFFHRFSYVLVFHSSNGEEREASIF